MSYELHTHHFVSGPRSGGAYRNGKWDDGEITHSHLGGDVPHIHPETGPSFYGYREIKTTKKPKGEQGLEVVPLTAEENTFTLVVTDSALIHGKTPIGDTPIEALGFPAANTMMLGFKMNCIVRDERKKRA